MIYERYDILEGFAWNYVCYTSWYKSQYRVVYSTNNITY